MSDLHTECRQKSSEFLPLTYNTMQSPCMSSSCLLIQRESSYKLRHFHVFSASQSMSIVVSILLQNNYYRFFACLVFVNLRSVSSVFVSVTVCKSELLSSKKLWSILSAEYVFVGHFVSARKIILATVQPPCSISAMLNTSVKLFRTG